MNLFADYVQPLTSWLQANPHWALFITFLIALTESLAVIGSIVPGSVTMTAIGILAGSGIMRVDLTLIAATLGAVGGDSISYALGYYYRDHLIDMWPFKKYPSLLKYGMEFFARHGGKSVLIGRFVGPLRSITPVIAGIMNMKQWRFLIANIISAIGWSLLYVMPGVLIGAAGHELSTESATRLFILILIILAAIWLISFLLKLLFIKLNSFLKVQLHDYWVSLKEKPVLGKLYKAITPEEETNHYATAGLLLSFIFYLLCFIIILILGALTSYLPPLNTPINLFLQSFHSPILESFFILCSQFTSNFTLIYLYISCCIWFIYQKNPKIIAYLTSLFIFSSLLSVVFAYIHNTPRPEGLLVTMPGSSFPAIHIVMGTAFYGFILFYINNNYSLLTNMFRGIICIILGLSGFSAVYLGDYWFTDVLAAYMLGLSICLIHWLIYRRYHYNTPKKKEGLIALFLFILASLCFTLLSTYWNFKTLVYNHAPYHKEFTLTQNEWWNQEKPLLPLYQLNRIGNKISLLNIQFSGDLSVLENHLEQYGWEQHTETFFTKVLMRFNSNKDDIKLPLLTQLYQNKSPELIMTYKDKQSKLVLELTIWESNYNLEQSPPLWIGTIHQNIRENKKQNKTTDSSHIINPLPYIMPALKHFNLRRVTVPPTMINTTTYSTAPYILLIKES